MTILTKNNLYEELEKWYTTERPLYENLANKVRLLIEDILELSIIQLLQELKMWKVWLIKQN
ncbi:hypothetical protein ACE1MS_22750 (plasmid) [Lysinibacillus sp. fkY74-1]